MIVKESDVRKKDIIGRNTNGTPILMVETKGGLVAIFANIDGKVEPVSAMNHIGLAFWLAEKKLPQVTWDMAKIKNWYEES